MKKVGIRCLLQKTNIRRVFCNLSVEKKVIQITLYTQNQKLFLGLGKRKSFRFSKSQKICQLTLALLNVDPHSHCVCGSLLLSRQEGIYIDCANHCAYSNYPMGWNLCGYTCSSCSLLCSCTRGIVKCGCFLELISCGAELRSHSCKSSSVPNQKTSCVNCLSLVTSLFTGGNHKYMTC